VTLAGAQVLRLGPAALSAAKTRSASHDLWGRTWRRALYRTHQPAGTRPFPVPNRDWIDKDATFFEVR
jgi:hypothetical protein